MICATFNPGFSGRSDISALYEGANPMTLIAKMTVPDYKIITACMLAGEGFSKHDVLANKLVDFFNYMTENAEKRNQYDFGLRNIKWTTRYAGTLLKAGTSSEEKCMAYSIRFNVVSRMPKEQQEQILAYIAFTFIGAQKSHFVDLVNFTNQKHVNIIKSPYLPFAEVLCANWKRTSICALVNEGQQYKMT